MYNAMYRYFEKVSIRTKLFIVLLSISSIVILIESMGIINISARAREDALVKSQKIVYEYINKVAMHDLVDLNNRLGFIDTVDRSGLQKDGDVQGILVNAVRKNSDFLGVFTADKSGKMLDRAFINGFDTLNYSGLLADETYLRARDSGKIQISPVKWVNKKPVISIAYPLKRAAGYAYVLFDVSKIDSEIVRIADISGMSVYIVDSHGNIMLSNDSKNIGKAFDLESNDLKKSNAIVSVPGGGQLRAVINKGVLGGEYVIIGQDLAMLHLPVKIMKLVTLFWLIIIAGLLYLLSILFAGYLLTPLLNVINGMKIVSNGNFDYQITTGTKDEIGLLGRSFNVMAEGLKDNQKEMLKAEAIASTSRLAERVGQEIRNPMMSINMASAMLARDKGREINAANVNKFTEIIRHETAMINKVSENLLIYANERRPVKSNILVTHLFNEVIGLAQKSHNAAIKLDIADGQLRFNGEFNEIRQALVNIIDNAIDSLRETGGEITLGVREQDGKMQFWVSDNGPGIAEENLSKIFEPMYSTKMQSVGLGLAVADKVVKRHNGKIEVESRPNTLTKFTVTIDKKDPGAKQ